MQILKLFSALLILLTISCVNKIDEKDYGNIELIISTMSLKEKIDFIGGNGFSIRPYEKYGIPEVRFADGPVGIRNYGRSIAYPATTALAAAWDKELAENYGKALAFDAKRKNVGVVLAPAMNIYRFPLCGRNFEYLGEDPYLAGQIAKEVVIGMQNEGVAATAKHFAANNSEYDRNRQSSEVDERTLHEIYLPAFKACVKEANVAAVMTSYNRINGIYASQHNYLINETLKGDWDFEGFVMSDWESTYDGVACAKAGLDLEMPRGKMMNRKTLIPAIENGEVEESLIDDKVRRILQVYKRFGLFKKPGTQNNFDHDTEFTRKTAVEIARKGTVLLKNENNMLPLKRENIKSIAVIGPNGYPAVTGGGGSSFTTPLQAISIVGAIEKLAKDKHLEYVSGYNNFKLQQDSLSASDFYIYKDGKKVSGFFAEYYNNRYFEGEVVQTRFLEKLSLKDDELWEGENVGKKTFSVRFSCKFTPRKSGYYLFNISSNDGFRFKINSETLFNRWVNVRGKENNIVHELKANIEYDIELEYFQNLGKALIDFRSAYLGEEEEYFAESITAAKNADVVIMPVGFNKATESEAFDRTFKMPNSQDKLINIISKVNKNIIVVLHSGGNVEMSNWINNAKALLHAWYPGSEGATAIAEIIFGDISPSGKLPMSFAYELEDYPTYNSYFDDDNDLKVEYSEGIFVGYRYWDKSNKKPRFPFGYGLSYTDFSYSNLKTNKTQYTKEENVEVSLKVKNTGNFDGGEVVQIYVSDKESSLPRPLKELKDFARVELKKGEEKEVTFTLNKDAFSFYNPVTHKWEVEPGKFEIIAASSSEDFRGRTLISIN